MFLSILFVLGLIAAPITMSAAEDKTTEQRYNDAKKSFMLGVVSGFITTGATNKYINNTNGSDEWLMMSGISTAGLIAVARELKHAVRNKRDNEDLNAYQTFAATGLGYLCGASGAILILKLSGKNGCIADNMGQSFFSVLNTGSRLYEGRYNGYGCRGIGRYPGQMGHLLPIIANYLSR